MGEYSDIITNILTLVGGGGLGWLVTARWERKKAKGEASQQEAVAAKEWQEVYTKALEHSNNINDELREDRKRIADENEKILAKFKEYDAENSKMREEYSKMHDKMIAYENEISDMKKFHDKEMSDMKKTMLDNTLKLQKVLPFVCQMVSCPNRVRLSPEDFLNDVG